MNLPQKYNQTFIDHASTHGTAFNDAAGLGTSVIPVDDPSQPHWRVIGIHYLTGAENHGQHHVFCDVLDEGGVRIKLSQVAVKKNDQPPATLTLDKPDNEPGTNTHMHWNDNLTIQVLQDGLPSEKATGFNTRHPDGEPGNTLGHHSFYVVFQKSQGGVAVPPGGVGQPEPVDPPVGSLLEDALWAKGQPLILPLNREASLYQTAQQQGLGERLTNEYEVMHQGQNYVAQIFELGLVYVPAGQWDQVKVLDQAKDVSDAVADTVAEPTILWDHHITGFHGNRGQYWDMHMAGKVPGLTRIVFSEDAAVHNPVLEGDGWVLKSDKVYRMPRGAGQPASPDSHPLVTPALPQVTPTPAHRRPITPIPGTPPPPQFVQVVNQHFHINGQAQRFIGANIRGLVHYGQDPDYFKHAPVEHRAIQLQAAKDMNARLVRVFLAHKDATPQEIERRLRDTLALMKAEFPDMYLLPALTNLYKDVPFYVQGDEGFYDGILNHEFYKGGYKDNYLPFVKHIVKTFKDEPQIFAWEIGNELKAENAPDLLVSFMTDVAAEIKTIDSNHMVTTGMISTRHAFMEHEPELRRKLYGSNNIDFITIHPYNGNEDPHSVEDDSDLAREFKKPLLIEEAGFHLELFGNRPEKTRADMAYWFGEGASCYMPWGFVKTPHDNNDGDKLIGMTSPLHGDFPELYELHRKCGHILLNNKIEADVRQAIQNIDYHVVREVLPTLPWPITVDGFDFPVGKPNADTYYVAAGLVDARYHANYGVWHTGEDWNGRGGGDSDLGDPVFAVAHGLVITAKAFSVWGNIVLLEHVLPTGRKVWSQYAHLNETFVNKGDIIQRGHPIGTIGKGDDDRYPAHLHFEIRLRKLAASKGGWKTAEDREKVLRYYAHPTNFINSYRAR